MRKQTQEDGVANSVTGKAAATPTVAGGTPAVAGGLRAFLTVRQEGRGRGAPARRAPPEFPRSRHGLEDATERKAHKKNKQLIMISKTK